MGTRVASNRHLIYAPSIAIGYFITYAREWCRCVLGHIAIGCSMVVGDGISDIFVPCWMFVFAVNQQGKDVVVSLIFTWVMVVFQWPEVDPRLVGLIFVMRYLI